MDDPNQILAAMQELKQSIKSLEDLKSGYGIMQERVTNFEGRLEKLENNQENNSKDIQKMVITINNLINKLDNTNKTLDDTNKSVDKLLAKLDKAEEEPKKFNKAIKQQVITTAISVGISMFMAFIVGLFVYYIKIK